MVTISSPSACEQSKSNERRVILVGFDSDRVKAHERVSAACFELAKELNELCPPGRNHSLMLTALEDVRMRGNAALACDSPKVEEPPSEEPPDDVGEYDANLDPAAVERHNLEQGG